jgi:hypothetical protein
MVNISTTVRGHYGNDVYLWAIIIRRFCDSRGLHKRPSAVILLLHHDRIVGMLRPPDCHVLLKAYATSVCFECFRCFRGMLQVFQMDVAKVEQDVAYVAKVYY